MLSTSRRKALFYIAFFMLAWFSGSFMTSIGITGEAGYTWLRLLVIYGIFAIPFVIDRLRAKGFKGSKLNEREHNYPLLQRAYLWGLRTRGYSFAYGFFTYWIMGQGAGQMLMSFFTTIPLEFGAAVFLFGVAMAFTGKWMKARYWAFVDKQLAEAHLRTVTDLQGFIVAQAAANPGQPVDLSEYKHLYPCNPRNMVLTADTPQDPRGSTAEHSSHT